MALKTWTHGSHSSSHSNHSSHSSSTNTTNSDSHSNSISLPTATISTSLAKAHSSTIGGVDWSGSFKNTQQLGVYGGTGSLTSLRDIVSNIRSRVAVSSNTSYNDNAGRQSLASDARPSVDSKATASGASGIVSSGGASFTARYQPYGVSVSATASGARSTTSPTATSKTQDIAGTVSGSGAYTSKSWTAAASGYQGTSTSYTLTDQMQGYVVKAAQNSTASYNAPSSGSIITKDQANAILTALQNETLRAYTGPASLGTYTFTGRTAISHSNHSSHSSSHGSHSSHSSSLRKYKENIHDYRESATEIIKRLKVVSFNYTPAAIAQGFGDDASITHIGIIADNSPIEVATHYRDRLDLINSVGLLFKAVQELSARVEKLEK